MTESSKATEDVDHSNVKSRFKEALVMLDFVTSDAGQSLTEHKNHLNCLIVTITLLVYSPTFSFMS